MSEVPLYNSLNTGFGVGFRQNDPSGSREGRSVAARRLDPFFFFITLKPRVE